MVNILWSFVRASAKNAAHGHGLISNSPSVRLPLDGVCPSGAAAFKHGSHGFGHPLVAGGIGMDHVAFQCVVP